MEQLTATAAYNEVKKILRTLDSLSKLGDILQIVANEEKIRNQIKEEYNLLVKESTAVKADLDRYVIEIENSKKKIQNLSDASNARVKELQDKEVMLMSETGQKLEIMKQSAMGQLEAVRMQLAKLQPQVEMLRKEKHVLEEDIALLKTRATTEMENMFNALKKIGN